MFWHWLLWICVIMLSLAFVYSVYKIIWYTVVMLRLKLCLKKWNAKFVRPFRKILFGRKGEFDFLIHSGSESISVAVVSYITNHSRLHIEKNGNEYFINVRRKKYIFQEVYNHSAEPEHSIQYRAEISLSRKPLMLEEPKDGATPVLLFFPKPKELTYAYREFKILYSGDEVCAHKVMFWKDLRAMLK